MENRDFQKVAKIYPRTKYAKRTTLGVFSTEPDRFSHTPLVFEKSHIWFKNLKDFEAEWAPHPKNTHFCVEILFAFVLGE